MQSNLKIGAQAESFYRWNENCYNKARELGFSYIDYDLCDTDKEWYQCDEAKMKEMMFEERERIEAAGITVSQVHGPWRWPPQDDTDENRAERLEKMKRSIVLTKYLGCKYFVIHPIISTIKYSAIDIIIYRRYLDIFFLFFIPITPTFSC